MSVQADLAPGTVFLAAQTTGELAKIQRIFENIIRDSYKTHSMRHHTYDEDKRRIAILIRYFRIMRGDKKWSLDRSLQMVRQALFAELDGHEYQWPPDDQVLYGVDRGVEPIAEQLSLIHI